MNGPKSSDQAAAELAVVIPTRDRRDVLLETLARLRANAGSMPLEVIVVDDGSTDGSADAVEGTEPPPGWHVTVLRQQPAGPAAARNRGVSGAEAPVCLFIGDDSLPTSGLIDGHLRFHRERPEATAAMLGRVRPAPPLDRSPLQVWLHEEGAQFGFANLTPGCDVDPSCFWTSNVSVKRELLNGAGGFDESFPAAACEDAELGLRLGRIGMRLTYVDSAVALHFHPTDLSATLRRMGTIGLAYRRLVELAPEMPEPRRPGPRHGLKAGALAAAMRVSPTASVRRRGWRFLCDQALRESYWGRSPAHGGLGTGAALARVALAEPDANPPVPALPA